MLLRSNLVCWCAVSTPPPDSRQMESSVASLSAAARSRSRVTARTWQSHTLAPGRTLSTTAGPCAQACQTPSRQPGPAPPPRERGNSERSDGEKASAHAPGAGAGSWRAGDRIRGEGSDRTATGLSAHAPCKQTRRPATSPCTPRARRGTAAGAAPGLGCAAEEGGRIGVGEGWGRGGGGAPRRRRTSAGASPRLACAPGGEGRGAGGSVRRPGEILDGMGALSTGCQRAADRQTQGRTAAERPRPRPRTAQKC